MDRYTVRGLTSIDKADHAGRKGGRRTDWSLSP